MTKIHRLRRLRLKKPLRATVSVLIALILAAGAFFQAASSALTKKNPELAAQLWSGNGLALEQRAMLRFMADVTGPDDVKASAKTQVSAAREAFNAFSLSPKTYSVFALAETDPQIKNRILTAASALNRRDLFLQGLALERFVEAKDYARALDTLDQLLRVHPEQKQSFFPILDQAFAEQSTMTEFNRILDGSSAWHESYLGHLSVTDALLPNLAMFRLQQTTPYPEFDREIVLRLAGMGKYDAARAVYEGVSNGRGSSAGAGFLDWRADYPPFDWQFTDEPNLRAQRLVSGEGIEIYVRSGNGGIVARRVLDPASPMTGLAIEHDLPIEADDDSIRLQISCSGTPLLDQPFEGNPARFDVQLGSANCDPYVLALYARAWTGRPAIRGTITSISIIK